MIDKRRRRGDAKYFCFISLNLNTCMFRNFAYDLVSTIMQQKVKIKLSNSMLFVDSSSDGLHILGACNGQQFGSQC